MSRSGSNHDDCGDRHCHGAPRGYRVWDLDGTARIDLHLNGGVFNLGHRNPEIIARLLEATESYDIGNHHFPSGPRALLAKKPRRRDAGNEVCGFGAGAVKSWTSPSRAHAERPGAAPSSASPMPTTGTPAWRWRRG